MKALAAPDPPLDKPTFHASLAAAYDAAALNQSVVLLIFGAEWCGPCKQLKKTTLGAEEFRERGGALRVFEVNIDTDEKTTKAFNVSAVPTLFLLSPEGKILGRRAGYLDVAELLKWIGQGRERMKQGQWEGIVPGGELKGLAAKAGADGLETNDLQRLIGLLAQPDPAERLAVGRLLLGQREKAVPFLIDAMCDPYLGVRIAASELLQKLSPQISEIDPWQGPEDLRETAARLRTWWANTARLPPAGELPPVDPSMEASIKSALDGVRGNDPIQRTESMSTLVNFGAAALPKVREAIKSSESKGDPRAIALLEDVFWAILIPDSVEKRAGRVRAVLARGTSPERQQTAIRLGRAGREAIPALAELVNDSDSLVAEKAVRALSSVGGKDAIAAMAALLKATDSNLRMTAAQALGKTKNPDAAKPLLAVLNDGNEIVVCTALAALEEVLANLPNTSPVKAETARALKPSLADARWRVRAAAAEVAGKLQVGELAGEVQKLVNDKDGFVVKNTLVALQKLGAPPEPSQLASLAKRLPSLRRDAVEMMIATGSEEGAQTVTGMYQAGGTDDRLMILEALSRSENRGQKKIENPWKPILADAAASKEIRLRRATVDVLAISPLQEAAELAGPFLADPDTDTRDAAAEVVIGILAGKRRIPSRMGGTTQIFIDETTRDSSGRVLKTNVVYATADQIKSWHTTLAKGASGPMDIRAATACYLTGDGNTGLPVLLASITNLDGRTVKQFSQSPGVGAIVRKLPWPEGKPVLEKLCSSPTLFALAALEGDQVKPEVSAYLLEPSRFKSVVEPAAGDELMMSLQLLLNGGNPYEDAARRKWSLLKPSEASAKIVSVLLNSTNPAWRAAAVHALGKLGREKQVNEFEKALQDSNPWVRAAGAKALGQSVKERAVLEQRLGPLLGETNEHVAQIAAMALLEPEVRQAAGLQWSFTYFVFNGKPIPTQTTFVSTPDNEERPLMPLIHKPPFLEHARQRLKSSEREKMAVFALLLAQYGEFEGVGKLAGWAPEPSEEGEEAVNLEEVSPSDMLMTAIALSRDTKFVPLLRGLMERMKQEYELRKILKALRGMSSPEARELRLEVNRRMRQRTNQPMME